MTGHSDKSVPESAQLALARQDAKEQHLFLGVGKGSRVFEGKTVNFREQYCRATQEVPVERDEPGP